MSSGVPADRRAEVAAALVQIGFIAANRAGPDNPAVEVLAELLPPDADIRLCLTCHEVSSSAVYDFAETTGQFPDRGSFYIDPGVGQVSGGRSLLTAPRRDFVVCSDEDLGWTASRVLSDREDSVTLYSVPFRDVVGAAVRHRRKGIVDVWVDAGPTLSFRVEPEAAGALQAHVDGAAQSQ